jgi:hypothetical protein
MAINVIGAGGSGGSVGQTYEQIFTTSGTWTKPVGVKTVDVTIVGGGATSFNSSAGLSAGGGGGVYKGIIDVTALATVPITVGAGGTNGPSNAASAGGNSSFGNIVTAGGGGAPANVVSSGGSAGQWFRPNVPGTAVVTRTTTNATGVSAFELSAGMTWNGSFFLAVYGFAVRKSTNGIAWTTVSQTGLTSAISVQRRNQMAFGNGLWVVGSDNTGQSKYAVSSNEGVTWTQYTIPGGAPIAMAISFVNGRWYLATNNLNQLYYSTDAVNWTLATTNAPTYYLGKVAFGNGVYVCCPLGESVNNAQMLYSSDGITWTLTATGQVQNVRQTNASVVWNPALGRFYTQSGNSGSSGSGNTFLYSSTNGVTWTLSATAHGANILSLEVSSGGLMAFYDTNNYSYYTANGLNTTPSVMINNLPNNPYTDGVTLYTTRTNVSNGEMAIVVGLDGQPVVITGYSPQNGSNPGVGGSSGGNPIFMGNASYVYPGPRVQGFGQGGSNLWPPIFYGDGAYAGASPLSGVVIVRWTI